MSETPPEARALRDGLELRWSDEREAELAKRVVKTHRRRRATKRAVAVTAMALILGGVGYGLRRTGDAPTATLADGSTIKTLAAGTDFVVGEQSAERVEIQLKHGRAKFAVTRNPKRSFRVHAGDVDVEVVGTVFEVDRQDGRTRVTVTEGRVQVTRGGLMAVLGPGDSRELDTTLALPSTEPPEVPAPPGEPEPAPQEPADHHTKKPAPNLTEVLREVDGLRLAGKTKAAVTLLRRTIHDRPNDAMLPQALFTLGRILQDDQHDPGEAAKLFATVRKRAPTSVLAEDALAREVECLVTTGAMEQARTLVRVYDQTYQRGAHGERLRKLVAPH